MNIDDQEPEAPSAEVESSQPEIERHTIDSALQQVSDTDGFIEGTSAEPLKEALTKLEDDEGSIEVAANKGYIQIGGSNVQHNYFSSVTQEETALEARKIFLNSIRNRDHFMSNFLGQALRQSNVTFTLSIYFMTVGGIIVLAAVILTMTHFFGSPSHGIALFSGIGGTLIGTSGAAFSIRADKARKHLSQQASMMQDQLLDEQKFAQVIDLLTGIRDPRLNDEARIKMATRLMNEMNTSTANRWHQDSDGSMHGGSQPRRGDHKRN
jgi:hypothetical protein